MTGLGAMKMESKPRRVYLEEFGELLDLLETVFRGNRLFFEHILSKDPWMKERLTFVIEEDGKLVSHVSCHMRPVRFGSIEVPMGGIGHVATLPQYRERHHSTALLQAVIDGMELAETPLSLLFTGINAFYERLHWYGLERVDYSFSADDALWLPRGEYELRAFGEEDLPAVMSLYSKVSLAYTLSLARSETYWRNWWTWADPDRRVSDDPRCFQLAFADDQLVAYGLFRPGEESTGIAELLGLPGHEQAMAALVANAAGQFGKPAFGMRLIKHHPYTDALLAAGAKLESSLSYGSMFRVNSLYVLLKCLLPELGRRLAAAGGGSGKLVIGHFSGAVALESSGDQVTVAPASRAEPDLQLPETTLLSLLIGVGEPLETLGEAASKLQPEQRSLLAALFPAGMPQYWPGDGF